jgi:multisubunit Na+/H+ antiporter MnhF subunit
MNLWLVAATALVLGLIPCSIVCLTAPAMDRLVALQLATVLSSLILLLMAEGFARPSYSDLALCLALLSFAGGLTFARFLERWL